METYRAETVPPRVHGGRPSLAVANPELAAEWDYEVNGSVTPWHVTAGSSKRVGWKCATHGHRWVAILSNRTKGHGCPICAGKLVLAGFNDLGSVNPALAAEWDQEANGSLSPKQVTASSGQKIGWSCVTHGHCWVASVAHRTRGTGCPFCAGKLVLAGFNDLGSVNPALAAEWDQEANGSLSPKQVTASSSSMASWRCTNYRHRWTSTVNNRANGQGCPTCANQLVLAGFNDLGSVDPNLAAEWDQEANGSLTPKHVTVSSNKKVGWKCTLHGHQWVTTVASRTAGRGCSKCSLAQTSKIEQAFFDGLQQFVDDAQNGTSLPTAWGNKKTSSADIAGTHHGRAIVVEYDGSFWHSAVFDKPGERTRKSADLEKTEALLADGYLVVRIRENDLPHLPIVNDNLHQLSFDIPDTITDERRAELVKPAVAKIMAWLDVAVARNS